MIKKLRNKIAQTRDYRIIRQSGLFDSEYYLRSNLDVARSCIDPIKHYILYGWQEGRKPNEFFDTTWYLDTYSDVADAKINPLCHYFYLGWKEGRNPSPEFSTLNYLNENPDIVSLNINPLTFYLQHEGKGGSKKIVISDILRESDLYRSAYQHNVDFSRYNSDIKAIVFFLPQFHQIPENDLWWGEGFTEWHNTQKAQPLFEGHYQPREPHDDIGYYNLAEIGNFKKQAMLARQHGIHGFCFYHYWFNGKRLLEKPIDMLLEHPDIDINFCLCWANENWTRTWDGEEKDILISQVYSPEDDIAFIKDLSRYMRDPRYIRINGKPVILIYRPLLLPEPHKTFERWRQFCRNIEGIGEILIWGVRGCFNEIEGLELDNIIDAEVEFPPSLTASLREINSCQLKNNRLKTSVYSYKALVNSITSGNGVVDRLDYPIYRSSMLAWDNTARRGAKGYVFAEYSLSDYYKWLKYNIKYTRENFQKHERFVFINAWNEWAEGTYLEPDRKYGYANLNTTSRALFDLPFSPTQSYEMSFSELASFADSIDLYESPGEIAVHVHVFYIDLIEELIRYLNNIPYDYDCYLTTDTHYKKLEIEKQIQRKLTTRNKEVRVTPNIGRDVAPFLVGCKDIFEQYNYICHLHTKKSLHNGLGDIWRKYLLDHLLGSEQSVRFIFNYFSKNPHAGLVYPAVFPLVKHCVEWGSNRQCSERLARRIGIQYRLPDKPEFPAGTMFWMRKVAYEKLFAAELSYDDFDEENGQIDGTLAHCFERLLIYIANDNGFSGVSVYEDK